MYNVLRLRDALDSSIHEWMSEGFMLDETLRAKKLGMTVAPN